MKNDFWVNTKILITGGHGFLGSHLIEALQLQGATKIVAPTRKECDFRDLFATKKLFDGQSFDVVFHLAASVGGIGANQKCPADFFYDNALMGIHLIDLASRYKVGKFILAGTICAYPKFAPIPFREEALWEGYPEETNAPYGVAKRSLVVAAESYRRQYGLAYTAIFPTNLYGPRDDFDLETSHVIPALIRKCEEAKYKNQKTLSLWGTGKPSRDFLYVKDAVRGLILAAENTKTNGETINLGSEREISIVDLARMISSITEFRGDFQWDSSKPDGQPRRCVSNEKASRILGFRPQYTLEEGIKETVQWYREQFNK